MTLDDRAILAAFGISTDDKPRVSYELQLQTEREYAAVLRREIAALEEQNLKLRRSRNCLIAGVLILQFGLTVVGMLLWLRR